MPFTDVTPKPGATTDRSISLDPRRRENDKESASLVARSRTRYNWPKCTTVLAVTRIMGLDHRTI